MKQKFSFWFIIGIGIGTALGFAFNNMGAGMCLGIGSSAIVTLLLNDFNNEHQAFLALNLVQAPRKLSLLLQNSAITIG